MTLRPLLALAWRESRFARRRLLLFLSAISLGVASLVAVQGFARGLARGVAREARSLLGADLQIGSRQPFGPFATAALDSLRRTGSDVAVRTSFASMAVAPNGRTRLAQVRAVEPGYPYYGTIETAPAGAWARVQTGRNALVDPGLLTALGARVGDSLGLGNARFRVLGTLVKVPGEAGLASSFAPRVYLPAAYLEATGLVGFGSRVEFDAYVRLANPGGAEALARTLQPRLRAERAGVDTAQEQQGDLQESFGRLGAYLSLVGVFALLLGGIGVASAMGAHMAQKADTVAVLRCLGATARQVFAVYLVQAAAMGLAGALLGVVLGLGVQWVLPRLVATLLPVAVATEVDAVAVLTGLGVGVGTALLFALLPLLGVRAVSPLGALRRRTEPAGLPARDGLRMLVWLLLAGSVFALLYVQVGRLDQALGMLAGIGAVLGVLAGAAWALVRGLRRVREGTLPYLVRQGLANLYRPGNQTRAVVLALGFGVFLLGTLLAVQRTLLAPLTTGSTATRPNLLFFDVQDDQEPGLRALLAAQNLPALQRAAIVPMRIAAIDGVPVRPPAPGEDTEPPPDSESRDERGARDGGAPAGWAVRREYRSTFRDTMQGAETLVAGRFWSPATTDAAQVSLEEDIAADLGVALGSRIDWDVQGVRVPTVVTSIRKVDWARFEPNFFAVFPTAALRDAPKTWVVLARAPTEAARAQAQQQAVARYANVAAVDLTQVQAALDDVVGRISAVIRFLAAFSIATGFVVLLGAVSASRLQRVREGVLLKVIGATRAQLRRILAVEYLMLGLLATLLGVGLALGGAWALARWVFETPFVVPAAGLALLGGLVVVLAVAIGLGASREVFRRTPLDAIRDE